MYQILVTGVSPVAGPARVAVVSICAMDVVAKEAVAGMTGAGVAGPGVEGWPKPQEVVAAADVSVSVVC